MMTHEVLEIPQRHGVVHAAHRHVAVCGVDSEHRARSRVGVYCVQKSQLGSGLGSAVTITVFTIMGEREEVDSAHAVQPAGHKNVVGIGRPGEFVFLNKRLKFKTLSVIIIKVFTSALIFNFVICVWLCAS